MNENMVGKEASTTPSFQAFEGYNVALRRSMKRLRFHRVNNIDPYSLKVSGPLIEKQTVYIFNHDQITIQNTAKYMIQLGDPERLVLQVLTFLYSYQCPSLEGQSPKQLTNQQ